MTIGELIKTGAEMLRLAGKDDFDFDASCIAQFVLNLNYTSIRIKYLDKVEEANEIKYFSLIKERCADKPLQYILGEWEFMGLPFKVGEGVLIPRPETELLVEYAVNFLKNKENPIVFDLCSGSGCIAISVAKFCNNAKIYAFEKSEIAFDYLLKNIKLNGVRNIYALNEDICNQSIIPNVTPDLILSNPPYISSSEINNLQAEVKKEPVMALDGGNDGLDFYRVISSLWIDRISSTGAVAVECGEDQTEQIVELFSKKIKNVVPLNDLNDLPRIVIAEK